jgi:hypothetical protein
MANIKITDLSAYSDPVSTDVLPIVDVVADVTKKVSIADLLENAGSGTAAAPGIAFDNDPNTGIYRPGADQVAISTGGTGRLFIDSSGRLGIGAASPAAALDIAGNQIFTAANPQIQFNAGGPIIRLPSANTLAFLSDSSTERLRIDSSGRVGIGTSTFSNAAQKLVIKGDGTVSTTDSTATYLNCTAVPSSTSASVGIGLNTYTEGAGAIAAIYATPVGQYRNSLKLRYNADQFGAGTFSVEQLSPSGSTTTTRLLINETGNVGVGNSNPGYRLDISAADTTAGLGYAMRLRENSTAGAATIQFTDSAVTAQRATITVDSSSNIRFGNSSERVRIDSSGRLGVGTSNPTNKITARGTNESGVLSVLAIENYITTNPFSGNGVAVDFNLNNNGNALVNRGKIEVVNTNYHAQSEMRFYTATSNAIQQRMVIDSSGRLGVGTSSPDSICTVVGGAIRSKNVDGDSGFDFHENGSAALIRQRNNRPIVFYTNNLEKVRLDSSGRVLVNSSVTPNGATFLVRGGPGGTNAAHLQLTSATSPYGGGRISVTNTGGGLEFYTHTGAVGSETYAERMSISSSGYVSINNMAVGGTANMHWSSSNGQLFVTSSSERFKHGITAYDKGLTDLMQLEPKYFTYNDEPGQKQRAGFIAEDFHALGLTEYVEYWNDEDGNATVPSEIGYSNMVAILVKSIQEQQTMIETLQAKVAALEGN